MSGAANDGEKREERIHAMGHDAIFVSTVTQAAHAEITRLEKMPSG